jgi:hypothetical protein
MINSQLKQYLIGNLPEELITDIDVKIISGVITEEEFQMEESELIEDFIDGMLSPEELEMFRNNFILNEQRKDEIRLLFLLKRYAHHRRTSTARN